MSTYIKELERNWNRKLKKVRNILKEFENSTIDNNHKFDIEKAKKSYYPKLRVNGIILVDCLKDNKLNVSSLKNFPLMGEIHTIETFKAKLKTIQNNK